MIETLKELQEKQRKLYFEELSRGTEVSIAYLDGVINGLEMAIKLVNVADYKEMVTALNEGISKGAKV